MSQISSKCGYGPEVVKYPHFVNAGKQVEHAGTVEHLGMRVQTRIWTPLPIRSNDSELLEGTPSHPKAFTTVPSPHWPLTLASNSSTIAAAMPTSVNRFDEFSCLCFR